jgi:hypothetical protein
MNRFDEICELAQYEDVIINFDKNKKGLALISLTKLKQIQEIEKSFQQLQRTLQMQRIRDNAEPGGTWDEFLAAIDEGLASDVVKGSENQILAMIEAGKKIEM